MLYKLYLKDGYLERYEHTYSDEDTYELNPLTMEMEFLNCYYMENGVLVLDETKKADIIAQKEAEETHQENIDEQTLRLAQMFVDMGVNVDDFLDRLDAQMLYTSLMTDTLLPDEEEE